MRSPTSSRLFACTLLASVPAQTFVVDAAGGTGTFTSIAVAVAAVPNGAVLDVLPGVYGSFTIDGKSVAVVGRPGAMVTEIGVTFVTVRNLAANQAVTLHGLLLTSGLAAARIQTQNCAGEVLVQACTTGGVTGCQVYSTLCQSLRLVACDLRAGDYQAMTLDRTTASIAATRLEATLSSGSAVRMFDSVCEVTDGELWGAGGPAMMLASGVNVVRLLGTARLIANQPGTTAPAIAGVGSGARSPSVVLLANGPLVGPGVQMVVRDMPAVAATVPTLGGSVVASMSVPGGGVGGLFVGVPGAGVVVAPFAEPLFLDPSLAIAVAVGVVSPLVVSVGVPGVGALLGVRVGWQGWSHDPVSGFAASNAVVTAIR